MQIVLVVFVGLGVGGCATTSAPTYDFPSQTRGGALFAQWFDGELSSEDVDLPEPTDAEFEQGRTEGRGTAEHKPSMAALFAAAEIDVWAGDVERAFERYRRMVRRDPDHSLVRFAAARLYELRDEVVDYRDRLAPVVRSLEYRSMGAMTRVHFSLIGQTLAYRRWRTARLETPFRAGPAGFPTDWRVTPRLSPWRLRDFDRSFPPREDRSLADRYVSPAVAEDAEPNRRRTRPYLSSGLSLSPSLGSSGVYYLETFARVRPADGGGARDYWLYGNFAAGARVWIDGEPVLEREPGTYGTSKRLRRIRLEPGVHRLLVKLSYSASRDWFDLAFLGDAAGPISGSGLSFERTPPDVETTESGIDLLTEAVEPSAREPVLVPPSDVDSAGDIPLYLTALAAYWDRRPAHFEPAWREFVDRHPEFAAGWGLRSRQVQTLWKYPSQKRRAEALSLLRRAHELDRDSLHYLLRLADRLDSSESNHDEIEQLLEVARRGAFAESAAGGQKERLRNIRALEEWAAYLEGRGWRADAERAWERTVEVAPSNCDAARSLHGVYSGRSHYPPLESITSSWRDCPGLREARLREQPDRTEERLALSRGRLERHPFRAGYLVDYVDELIAAGQGDRAVERLERATEQMPWSERIWRRLAERRLARSGTDAAVETLERAIAEAGHSASLLRASSTLRGAIPLEELIVDGREVAMEHLASGSSGEIQGSSDAAYFVVDYAARQYLGGGVSRTLTHQLVRVTTKGALDDYGEQSIPGNAELLRIRTINRDGTTRVPRREPGKSTYSMPGLDPGDFVELAYLRYDGPSSLSRTHREGMRFFFRMPDVSSLHSEFAVLGTEDGEFIRQNAPPEAESYTEGGYEGVRFLEETSSRPRRERFSVSGTEFFPWVQYYRGGLDVSVFEARRRGVVDTVRGSLRPTGALRERVEEWRAGAEPGSERSVENLFYAVADWFSQSNPTAFSREVNHALLSKRGSPHLLLKAALDLSGVSSEIYLVKSAFEHPEAFPVREFYKYRRPLVRVDMPGGAAVWLDPAHQDAMYGALEASVLGQPAVCVSCREDRRRTVTEESPRAGVRDVSVDARLSADGDLSGTATLTYRGVRAANLRSILRRNPEETERAKYLDTLIGRLVSGASSVDYRIRREDEHDRPIVVEIDFERSHFASKLSEGGLRVQSPLLREPMASIYAKLKNRQRPMLATRRRHSRMEASIALPEGASAEVRRQKGRWEVEGPFGSYERSVALEGGAIEVSSALEFPIQRISLDAYREFRRWAIRIERSSRLSVDVRDLGAGE